MGDFTLKLIYKLLQFIKLLNSNLSETLIINDLMNENGDNCGTQVIIKININEGNAE